MRKHLSNVVSIMLYAAVTQAAYAQDRGTLKLDCAFESRTQAHQLFTVDFEQRTVNKQPAMIGPDAMHWKEGGRGYKLDRPTGVLTLLIARDNVVLKLQCDSATGD